MPAPPISAAEAARLRFQRQRLRRRVLFFVYGVPLALLATAVYVAFGPKPPPPPRVMLVSPQRTAAATQNIDAVRQALTQLAPVSVPTPTSTTTSSAPRSSSTNRTHVLSSPVQVTHQDNGADLVTMRISQGDLNAYLSGNAKVKALLGSKGIQAVSVGLTEPANITILAAATFQGVAGNAQVSAVLEPDPATAVHLTIVDARFGRFPPPVIMAAANQIVAHVIGGSRSPLPLNVTSVKVVGSDLVLTGTRRAAQSPSL